MVEWSQNKFEALRMVVPTVSRETAHGLMLFEEAVKKWQSHINLIANATVPYLWNRHILDSAQVFPLGERAIKWCDVGSGGGFPAIVIAFFLKQCGNGHVYLIESNGKKASFLRTMVAEFGLPATVYHCRIEESYMDINNIDVITSRALASLNKLFQYCEPWLCKGAKALFQKGKDYEIELDEARVHWDFDLIKHSSKIDRQSVILELSNVRSREG